MKTLTKNNVSLYLFPDDEYIEMTEVNIVAGNPAKFIIGDCSSKDTVLHEGIVGPEDWYVAKYLFDGSVWALNPNFVEHAE